MVKENSPLNLGLQLGNLSVVLQIAWIRVQHRWWFRYIFPSEPIRELGLRTEFLK